MEGEPEAYKDDSLKSISITPKERLERIEAMLVRIDEKIDFKFSELEKRIWTMEVNIAPAAEAVAEDVRRLDNTITMLDGRVRVIEDSGSKSARHADETALKVQVEVEKVQRKLAYYAGGLGVLLIVIDVGLARGWF